MNEQHFFPININHLKILHQNKNANKLIYYFTDILILQHDW